MFFSKSLKNTMVHVIFHIEVNKTQKGHHDHDEFVKRKKTPKLRKSHFQVLIFLKIRRKTLYAFTI